MALNIIKTANLGTGMTGQTGNVNYTLYWPSGDTYSTRRTTGIYEVVASSGIYGVNISVATDFSGSIVWDVTDTSVYAVESIEEDVNSRYNRLINSGRWKIDASSNQMIFYKDDNTTEIARYNLKDRTGAASVTEVFDRERVN
jgi:hypothetical protein